MNPMESNGIPHKMSSFTLKSNDSVDEKADCYSTTDLERVTEFFITWWNTYGLISAKPS